MGEAQSPVLGGAGETSKIGRGPPRQAVEIPLGTRTQSPCEGNAQVGARKRGFLSLPCSPEDSAAPYQQEGKVWTFLCYR